VSSSLSSSSLNSEDAKVSVSASARCVTLASSDNQAVQFLASAFSSSPSSASSCRVVLCRAFISLALFSSFDDEATRKGRNRGVPARSGVIGQDRAVSISSRNANRSTATTALAKRDRNRDETAGSLPSRATLANRYCQRDQTIFLSFPPSRDTYTPLCARPPRHPSLCFHAIYPFCTLPPFPLRPLYPACIHLGSSFSSTSAGCRSCTVLSPASVWLRSRACLCLRMHVCMPRAFLRGCVGRVTAANRRGRTEEVSFEVVSFP